MGNRRYVMAKFPFDAPGDQTETQLNALAKERAKAVLQEALAAL